jgi:ABC-type Na+ efflux pump permease subunit
VAFPPIIERELRVALRKKQPARRRIKVAGICVASSLCFLLFSALVGSRGAGRELHQLLCFGGLYVVIRAPMLIAGSLADERRNQTLGLLFLSGLSASEVFLSKFLSATLIAFTELLAMFPMLALPFLIGGVSFDLFLATVVGLPTLLVLTIALSLLSSVLTRDDGAAVLLTAILAVVLCVITPAIYYAQTQYSPGTHPSRWWLRLSPAYGPYLVHSRLPLGTVSEFWSNWAFTILWSVAALGLAAGLLKRLWRERETVQVAEKGWAQTWRGLVHGDAVRRDRLASRWLNSSSQKPVNQLLPFAWLTARDFQPAAIAWGFVSGIVLVWFACWAAWPSGWPSVSNFFITATLLNLGVGWLIRYTAARAIGVPRQDGTYELLLTTPLNPKDIVRGQLEGLRALFRPVTRVILVLELIMTVEGLSLRTWNQPALFVYFAVWLFMLALTWTQGWHWRRLLPVMWASLNCARPAHAVWRCSGLNSWSWIWIAINLSNLLRGFSHFPKGSPFEVIFVVLFGGGYFLMLLLKRADFGDGANHRERRLVTEFREIVREPLPDPHDPRFKQWNIGERFPWGWGLVQHQLHERLARTQMER